MQTQQLQELLVDCVRDIYDAEKQLVKALPKMAKAAEAEDLVSGIESHFEETKGQVARLEQVFGLLGVAPKGKPCKGMKGLIEEGSEAMEEGKAGRLRDLAIIAAAQKVEHYEISAYGTARTIAEQLGNREVVALLRKTEEEETAADENLSAVAMVLYAADEDAEGGKAEEANTKGNSARKNMARVGGTGRAKPAGKVAGSNR